MQEVRREVPEATKYELTEYEREGAWFLDGLDEGRVEGRVEGLAEGLLLLLGARNLALDPEQRARIETCTDPQQLRRWFERALQATSVAEIMGSDA